MSMPNPYAADLGTRDALEAFTETPFLLETRVASWNDQQFERSYAPGKWSMRQVLIHLAQTELALGARVRFALTQDGYTAQSSRRTTGCRSTAPRTPAPRSGCTPSCAG